MKGSREKIKAVKGMRDIFPPDSRLWRAVEATAAATFESFGYEEMRTPVVEPTPLFVRSIGDETDIVNKEMYTFQDKKGRSLTLRPEGTASIARAYIEHDLRLAPHPQRYYYLGPMFRYERPQKGRYRQFFQIGAELIGSASPQGDVEMLAMVHAFLTRLRFTDLTILLNSVGCPECRPNYRAALVAHLTKAADRLCNDCRRRTQTNPIRVLDCKVPACGEVIAELPTIEGYLCEACRSHHDAVTAGLEDLGLAVVSEPQLVRGLDYYTRTVFEVTSQMLGAQNALLGGGRYDRLIEDLGGTATPGIGFAIGEDRIIEILPDAFRAEVRPEIYYLLPLGEVSLKEVTRLAGRLRESGLRVVLEIDGRSVKQAMKFATRSGFTHVLFFGEEEAASGKITVKNLETREQETLPLESYLETSTHDA